MHTHNEEEAFKDGQALGIIIGGLVACAVILFLM